MAIVAQTVRLTQQFLSTISVPGADLAKLRELPAAAILDAQLAVQAQLAASGDLSLRRIATGTFADRNRIFRLRTITANRTGTTFWIDGIFSIAKDHADLAKVRPVPLVMEIPPLGAGRAGRWAIWGGRSASPMMAVQL